MNTMNTIYLDQQTKKLTTRQIDRRQFILSMLAAGITLPTAISMAGDAIAATPKKGGKIRFGLGHGSTTDSLDPATFENGFMTGVGFLYGNHLTEVDNKGDLVPDLAANFSPSDDGKVWFFELRNGVEFHNGKTLSADDVITSLNYHRGEKSKSAAKEIGRAHV